MIEYSFDNSLLNSQNSRNISHTQSYVASERESVYKLSAFSENQCVQNFIKKKVLDYNEKNNIYRRISDERRYQDTNKILHNTKNLLSKFRMASSNERQIPKETRDNIHKMIGKQVDNMESNNIKNFLKKAGPNVKSGKNNQTNSFRKTDLLLRKKLISDVKDVKLNIKAINHPLRLSKPVPISTTSKTSKKSNLFGKKKISYAGFNEYNKMEHPPFNNIRKIDKLIKPIYFHTCRDHLYKYRNHDSISIEKSSNTSYKSMAKRNFSIKVLTNTLAKNVDNLKISKSKESLCNDENYNSWQNNTKFIKQIREDNKAIKLNFNSYDNYHESELNERKDKFEKPLNKIQKNNSIKQEYMQKLVNNTKSVIKHYKTFSHIRLSSDDKNKSNNKTGLLLEREEYTGNIELMFNESNSNITTDKSIDNFEYLVNRIYNKAKR